MGNYDGFTGPINTGNPGEFTIKELAGKNFDLTGSSSNMDYKPMPSDDPIQRQPDISLTREKLGWEPNIKLAEGLRKTIPCFDELLKVS